MSYIVDKVKGTMNNALSNFSKELNVPVTDVSIVITTNDESEGTPIYELYKREENKNALIKEITFNEILNVKIDFQGREQMAAPFLAETLKRMAKETDCSPKDIELMVRNYENAENNPYILLHSKKNFVKNLSFEEDIFQGI